MKYIFFILSFAFLYTMPCKAATAPAADSLFNANTIMLQIGKVGTKLSLADLAYLNTKEYEQMTGEKLGFFEKLGFKMAQKKLRSKINANGSFKKDVLKEINKQVTDSTTNFHGGGFLLGLFFSWLGVLVAYLVKDTHRKRRIKWAWIGAGVNAAFFILVVLIFANNWGK